MRKSKRPKGFHWLQDESFKSSVKWDIRELKQLSNYQPSCYNLSSWFGLLPSKTFIYLVCVYSHVFSPSLTCYRTFTELSKRQFNPEKKIFLSWIQTNLNNGKKKGWNVLVSPYFYDFCCSLKNPHAQQTRAQLDGGNGHEESSFKIFIAPEPH